MSRFKSIRNKINKKSSISVDEKLAALDKELEKTGMSNVSEMMTTDNVLSSSEYVPPQDRIEGDVPNSSGMKFKVLGDNSNDFKFKIKNRK